MQPACKSCMAAALTHRISDLWGAMQCWCLAQVIGGWAMGIDVCLSSPWRVLRSAQVLGLGLVLWGRPWANSAGLRCRTSGARGSPA